MRLLSVLGSVTRGFAFFLAFGCAMFSLLSQLGRWSVRLDALTHAAPLYLAGAVISLALWAAADRKGRAVVVMAAAALLSTGVVMGPELLAAATAERAAPREETIKLIQFNLYYDNIDIDGTIDWLVEQEADFLVFEEAYDDAAVIPDRLAAAYPHRAPCKSFRLCGTTILAKRPPLELGDPEEIERGSGQLTWAKFAGRKGTFMVAGTHYVWPDPISPQWINREAMRRNMQRWPTDSLILTGDFNSTPWSFSLRRQDRDIGLIRRTRALLSWPSRIGPFNSPPLFPIDQVYAGPAWKTVSVRRGPRLGSDHFPVVVVLTR